MARSSIYIYSYEKSENIIYCSCDNGASAKTLVTDLKDNGYNDFYYMSDSFRDWVYETVSGSNPGSLPTPGGLDPTFDDTWFEEVLQMATKYPRIYLDTSAVTYHLENRSLVNRIRETCGFNRILFGTDTPVVLGTSMEHSKYILENNPILSKEEKLMILSENAKELFQIM